MYFANNLLYLRKKHKLTQEELAFELAVSRQSVSKWETGEAYPDTDKLIMLCDKFNVTMDNLVRFDIEAMETAASQPLEEASPTSQAAEAPAPEAEKIVDHDKAISHINKFAKAISIGVALILIGVSFIIGFSGIASIPSEKNMEPFAVLGVAIMLIFVAAAVLLFVFYGMKEEAFNRENQGAKLVLTPEEKQAFEKKFALIIAISVSGLILLVVGLIASTSIISFVIDANDKYFSFYESLATAIFIAILSLPIFGLCYAGIKHSHFIDVKKGYHVFTNDEWDKDDRSDIVGAIIMPACAAIYLVMGFVWHLWHPGWVIFPIGGILCGIISAIINCFKGNKK